MEYQAISEVEAIQLSYQDNLDSTLLISITCPETKDLPKFHLNESILYIHRMKFHDLNKAYNEDCQLLTKDQVLELQSIVDGYKDQIKQIVVHCTAGISRSSAIAAELALYLGDSDDFIWTTKQYLPNKHCFTLMNQVLALGLTKDAINQRYQTNQQLHPRFSTEMNEIILPF